MNKGRSSKKTAGIVIGLLVALVAVAALGFAFMGNLGGGENAVPKVIGQTEEAARETLERAGYAVGSVSEDYSADVVAGRVCQQDPEGSNQVGKGRHRELGHFQGRAERRHSQPERHDR